MLAVQTHDDALPWPDSRRNPQGLAARATSVPVRLWRGRSVRSQVLATFVLINILAVMATSVIVVFNAKRATEVEIAASIAVAERVVRASIDDLAREVPGGLMLEDLIRRIGPMRHVRLLITTPVGRPIWQARPAPNALDPQGQAAPAWFAALISIDNLSREVPILSSGQRIGSVLVLGEPRDEIAEVWADMSGLAAVAGLVNLSVILLLYFAFGRVLTPLSALSEGLHRLEQGHLRHRLAEPTPRELAELARRFNALAGSLGLAREENLKLHRDLMTAEDTERRLIAMELHDELGPCLFGLKANMGSLERLADDLSSEKSDRMRERLGTLVGIVDRIQMANRQMLRRLRPAALGEIALADAIAALLAEFTQHDGAPRIDLRVSGLADSYSESIDLTIYRCVQEGLTNVLRHAHATSVSIVIDGAERCGRLQLTLMDDGCGIPPDTARGMGLSGMKQRVEALGGIFAISESSPGGTRVAVSLPIEPGGQAKSQDGF